MTREEFVQRLIVNAMCDDFENVDQVILRDVAGVAAKCGLTVERPELVQNLRALGLRIASSDQSERGCMPNSDAG
jgi:hypothetical protein